MSNDKKIHQHPGISHHDDIQTICKPLHNLDVTYFAHVRMNPTGEFNVITNNPDYQIHYLENQYYNCDVHLAGNDPGDLVIWDCVRRQGNSEKMVREAKEFGVDHLFTLIKKGEEYSDYFHFASAVSDETINQRYLSQRNKLEKFTHHFLDKIKSNKQLSKILSIEFGVNKNEAEFDFGAAPSSSAEIPDSQKYYVSYQNKCFTLSAREYLILHWLGLGKTAAEVGLIHDISASTVRKHIENIKQKSGCYTAFQLGALYASINNQ